MEQHVADNPEIHPIVAGTGGVRKARWGHRAKNEKEDLTPADKQQLIELVNRLRGIQ